MPTLVTTKPVPNTEVDANVLANNFTAIENIINGALDETNIASGLVYSPSKIKQGGATTGQYLRWNGSAWAPAGIAGTFFDLRNPQVGSNAGNVFSTVTALTAWEAWHWEFTKDVDGKLFGVAKAGGGETSVILSLGANATSGVTRMSISYALIADTESLNPGSLTAVTAQDITVPGTARNRKDVTFTITAPDAGDLVLLSIYHEGLHANDTLAVNTELYWAALA